MVPDEVTTTTRDAEQRKLAGLKQGRANKAAYRRDREDRDSMTERIKALVCKEIEGTDPDEIEIIYTGDLSDAIIFIPEEPGSKTKIAHRLKPGV